MNLHLKIATYVRALAICVLLICSFVNKGYTQTFTHHTTEGSAVATGDSLFTHGFHDTLTVWCNDWDNILSNITNWGDDFKLKSNHSFVKFYVNKYSLITKYQTQVNYNYTLAYRLYGFIDPSDTVTSAGYVIDDDTLTINFNNDDINTPYQDLNIKKYSNFYKIIVDLVNIYRDSAGIIVPVILTDTTLRAFAVEASILTQHYDKHEYGMGTGTSVPVVTATPHLYENYLDLSWTLGSSAVTPINYELEWTYIDDYQVSLGGFETPKPLSDLSYDFRFNNTRVWLSTNNYKIPLVYPRGYIAYRVRAVRPDSIQFKYPVYGNWSISPQPDHGNLSALSTTDFYYISTPYTGDSLNWQYTASFAEGGKYKNVTTFYDGLLKNRQSITRLNSNFDKLIATGNVYDHEGRLCIKSLPTPINVPSFTYQYNLLLNSATSAPYKAADFDTGSLHFSLISPLAGNALANIYYSSQNHDTSIRHQKFVADAQGYPLVQTIFESGSQSRVLAQSGAGAALQIGNPNYVANEYVDAQQPLLNSLFGPNVGWKEFYTMTVSRDPNQQYSMTINDYQGKPMVSALIGDGPGSSTHAIDQVNYPDSNYVKQDLLAPPTKQDIDIIGGSRTADINYFNEANATDSIQYACNYIPYQACPGQYLMPKGRYQLTVSDQYDNVLVSQDSVIGYTSVDTSSAGMGYLAPIGHFPAHIGKYHITKSITVSPWEFDAVMDSFFKVANCFLPLPTFIRQTVSAEQFPCQGDLGGPAYDSDECISREWLMMQQLLPNAAYGKYTIKHGTMVSTPNSIYTIFCDCYHAFTLYGEDTSLIISRQGARNIVNHRAPFTEITIRDTCVTDTFFTHNITIKAFSYFDSIHTLYMPFLGAGGASPYGMEGSYTIQSNWNLGRITGPIYANGVIVGSVSQRPGHHHSVPDTTIFTLPVSVSGARFFADLHGNALSSAGDSLFFKFSGEQTDPYAHAPSWSSPYVDWSDPGCLARYQDTCLLPNFPDTITVNGVFHAGLRTMDHIAFNELYAEAVTAGNYSIARALLPLHPQYCELRNCFTDDYKKQLQAIPDWRTAQAMNMLYLDSLIAHDPIVSRMSATGIFPNPQDSLRKFRGNNIRLDSFIFMNGYCGSMDSVLFTECVSNMFNYEIVHHQLVNDDIKKYYFTNVANLYLSNRQRFVDSIFRHSSNTCGPCSVKRMKVDGKFRIMPYPVPIDSPLVLFPGEPPSGWVADVFHVDSLQKLQDSVTAWHHTTDSTLAAASIDHVIDRIGHCVSAAVGASTRAALLALVTSGRAPSGNFTSQQVFDILRSFGVTPNDLCNPYSFNFSNFGNQKPQNNCRSDAFYADIASFLGRLPVSTVLHHASTGATPDDVTLDSTLNALEREIARRLGNIAAVKVWAQYDAGKNLYTLHVYEPAGGADTVKVMLHTFACTAAFASLTPGGYTTTAKCINSDKLMRRGVSGIINQYSFLTNVTNGSTVNCYLIGWMDSVRTMSNADESPIARCVPCTQMRRLYTQFNDSMQLFQVKGADHPLYKTMLANFMNDALHEQYTAYHYETFINSCALADSMEIPMYTAYATFKFGDVFMALAFINSLNSVDPEFNFSDSYADSISVGGLPEFTICVDLNKVPENKMHLYRNALDLFASYGGAHINVPLKDVHGSGEIGFIHEDPAYPFDPVAAAIVDPATGITFSGPHSKAVFMGGKFEMRTFYYVVKSSGTTPADISRAIYNITAHIYNHDLPGVVFVPEYKSTIDADYFKPEKQAYLSHVYDFQHLPDYEVLNKLQAANLVATIPSYSLTPYNAVYSKETTSGLFSNLYLWNAGMNTRYYDTLQHMLDLTSPTGYIFNAAPSVSIPLTAPAQLNAYRSSDWSYWYRYFTTGDTLFNAWLRFPDYIPASLRPSYKVAGPIIPLPADSLNRHFALHVTIPGSGDTITLQGLSSFVIGNSIELDNLLLRQSPLADNGGRDTFYNCERQRLNSAIHQGIANYNRYIDSIRTTIGARFREHVLTSLHEQLDLGYTTNKKFFTLYNYDRAGNLISTIPPAGSTPIPLGPSLTAVDNARSSNTPALSPVPTITKVNRYQYTSTNQLLYQSTINAGGTYFWFDIAGRVAFSQNAKQALTNNLSYNLYDAQGRIIETGEGPYSCPLCGPPGSSPSVLTPLPDEVSGSQYLPYERLVAFIMSQPRVDVVHTTYDTAATPLHTIPGFSSQENLRKRIACVKYFLYLDPFDSAYAYYDHATHYSYDPQGNVKTLTHDYPLLYDHRRQYTRVDYDYDVISGKVNMLSCNRGFPDQFYQKYTYDPDNRITHVHTSPDGYIWQQDAHYTYYDHGPLARTELGDLRVQGMDYAYTIQGWLKALNGDSLSHYHDMGHDGSPVNARDAVAHTIDYFANDYSAITGRNVQHTATPLRSLYNGNIVGQATAIDTFQRLYKTYAYDQLNRILKADYATIDIATGALTGISDYRSRYSYDPDGNITTLTRWGNNTGSGATVMDSLSYHYQTVAHNDLLEDVTDSAANTYTNDLQQHLAPSFRYSYDAIGNLSANRESGQDTIYWNLYNKVTKVVNSTDTSELSYDYDAMGNRVGKHYLKRPLAGGKIYKSEYYLRDAQGNILATYKGLDIRGNTVPPYSEFALSAHDIYGSARLGQKNYFGTEVGTSIDYSALPEGLHDTARFYTLSPWYSLEYQDVIHKDSTNLYGSTWQERSYARHATGMKQYEVTDHLGNVLAALSDKRAGDHFAGTLTPGANVAVDAWKPIVTAAYDYYPFGQYMPARYTVDTATHCLSTTYSGMGSIQVPRPLTLTSSTGSVGGGTAGGGSAGPGAFTFTATTIGDAAEGTYTPISVYGNYASVYFASPTSVVLYIIDNNTGDTLGSNFTGMLSPVTIPISPLPHSSTIRLRVVATSIPTSVTINALVAPQDTTVPINILANVCNGGGYRYGFNGQMKDNEWAGLGNHVDFGARGLDTRTGRWQSVDELFKKYPGISPYAFCLNNPNIYADKDGRDAVLIVFPDYKIDAEIKVGKWKAPKVGGLGHAGALIINNKNGQATYYEYGRYQTSDGTKGKVQKYSVGKISFDADGKPTTESLNKALGKISEKSGQGGRIDGAYIISEQYGAMKDYADRRYNESNPGNPSYDKDRDPYTLSGNNCGTFAEDCINQDPSVDQPNVWVKSPSNIVNEYQEEGNAKVTYDPKTKTTTMGKGDESDAKKGTPPPNSGKPAKK